MEETIEKINIKDELEKLNSRTIFEFQKTIENFEIDKLKEYIAKEDKKIISFLFYDNEFFAVDRITCSKDAEEKEKTIAENLNYKIRKIPNVAKTRKILSIDDIETRIYDISEYIVLLKKEEIKLLKVNNQTNIEDLKYSEYKINKEKMKELIEEYQTIEYEEIKEERKLKNRVRRIKEKVKYIVIELKSKLLKTNEVKMLSDGKHSVFDKED